MTLRFRAVNRDIFEAIRLGRKRVETRAATDKYVGLKAGETMLFVCGKEKFERVAKKVMHFSSIRSMLSKYTPQDINPRCLTEKELREVYWSFPGYKEKIQKYGLIAIELG